MKKLFFALVALCAFVSCNETDPTTTTEDAVALSVDKLNPTASGGEYEISAERDDWWINSNITVDGESYYLSQEDQLDNITDKYILAQFSSFDGSGEQREIVSFSHEWFTVTKSSATEMQVKIEPNYTKESRTLTLYPQAGSYAEQLTVTQSGAEVSNLRFSDVKFKGDQLTIAEAETLTQQIEADAYSGMQFYDEDEKIRLFSDEDAGQFVEYKYKFDPKEEDVTAEEAAALARIERWINQYQDEAYFTLSNEDETTLMLVSYEDIVVRSTPPSPTYFHIDVTDRYKDKYPELEFVIATYRPY